MIQLNPDNLVRVELTAKEQKTLLKYCQSIDRDIYNRIMNAPNGVLNLFLEDCQYLRGCIQLEIERITIPKVQNILGKVFNKLSTSPITQSITEEIEKHDYKSIDDLNDHLQGFMEKRNSTPDPEMGGLSPEQVSRLIYLKWDDENFPIKFNDSLELSDIKHSIFFFNTVTFLKTLLEMEKEKTATARGNLNRKTVKILFERLFFEEEYKEFTLKYNNVLNEMDVFPLHIIRVICEAAGLVHRRKDKFLVTQKHQKLLSDENAGKLYHLLFVTYFRKFNLAYQGRLPELQGVQQTIAYSFIRLMEICRDYQSIEGLQNEILLPAVLDEVEDELSGMIFVEWVIVARIIQPLEKFGLLECLHYKEQKGLGEIAKARKTKLFDKFIKMEW